MEKYQLLVVDDNVALLNALVRLLRSPDYIIHRASSASQGWEILAKQHGEIDLVISDNQMPGERGVDFLKSVKHHYPDTLRIMVTGNSSVRDVEICVNECEVYRFFTKPWDPDTLRETVREGLRFKSIADAEYGRKPSIRATDPVRSLEKHYPGITQVDRDSQGYVVLSSRFPTRVPIK
ncbi:MAG: response regulator [Myxococcales bacterium]|nr:MAG: response regulator [Myxococcales bacterium]